MIKLHFSANATYTLYSQTQRNQSKWHSMLQIKSGSTLLSCATSLKLDLIKLHPRLGVPPPWAKIITSQADWTSPSAKRVTQGKVMFDEMQSTVQEPLVQASYSPVQRPLTALYRSPVQKRTISCKKMSQVSKQSAWWDEFNGTKISPIWPLHMAPFQASYSPIQEPHSKVICQS